MKKLLISLLIMLMSITMLLGCGGGESTGSNNSNNSSNSEDESKDDIGHESDYESEQDTVVEDTEEDLWVVEPGKTVSMMQIQEYMGAAAEGAKLIALKTGEDYLVLDCCQSYDDGDGYFVKDVTGNHRIAADRRVVDIQIQPDSQIVQFGGISAGGSAKLTPVTGLSYCLPFYLLGTDYPNGLSFHYNDNLSKRAFVLCLLEGEHNMEKFGKVDIAEVDGVPINADTLIHMGERVNGLANPTYIFTDKETITVGGFYDTTFVEYTFSCGLFAEIGEEINAGEYIPTKEGYFITVDSDVLNTLNKNECYIYGLDAIFRIVE